MDAAIVMILEMFRISREGEVVSDFYLITNPFLEERHRVTKKVARKIISENNLVVSAEDKTGRIYDTPNMDFKKKWAASSQFIAPKRETDEEKEARLQAKKDYKEALMETLDIVWGDKSTV